MHKSMNPAVCMEAQRHGRLVDDFASTVPDHRDAEDLVGLGICHHLDNARVSEWPRHAAQRYRQGVHQQGCPAVSPPARSSYHGDRGVGKNDPWKTRDRLPHWHSASALWAAMPHHGCPPGGHLAPGLTTNHVASSKDMARWFASMHLLSPPRVHAPLRRRAQWRWCRYWAVGLWQ